MWQARLIEIKSNPKADTKNLESQIDSLVHKLYGLNSEDPSSTDKLTTGRE